MVITEKTKISAIIKENEKAIDVIASINAHFKKLYNPVLRKLLAPRVTVEQAAKIGKTTSRLILEKLKEINFDVELPSEVKAESVTISSNDVELDGPLTVLDVRDMIASFKDPFSVIMNNLKQLPENGTLVLINSFDPIPLKGILGEKGFSWTTIMEDENTYKTFFRFVGKQKESEIDTNENVWNFEELYERNKYNMKEVDVRHMEMPYPMITVLNKLAEMKSGEALLVHHVRVPQFLLPKLDEMKCGYAIKQISNEDVKLIIIKT
ncbi:MAG: DUF2249 domain-containing protein [Cytophagaceae bacterium]